MGNCIPKKTSDGRGQDPSEMRIVLLGYDDVGKESVMEDIFNTYHRTATSPYTLKEVSGRQVGVVNTSSWQDEYLLQDSPELIKREIMLSVSLCSPGPHCLLLVIPMDYTFTERRRKAIQQHVELLGDTVWNHTMVLFLCSIPTSIEPYIEHQGKALQWLVEKCGKRYHLLAEGMSIQTEASALLKKIEKMVRINHNKPFEVEKRLIEEVRKRRRLEQIRAEERKQKLTETWPDTTSMLNDLTQIRIVLLGSRIVGKSSTGNTILYGHEFNSSKNTGLCVKKHGHFKGQSNREVTVVDTPGWCSKAPLRNSAQITKDEIVRSVSLCPPGPHAFILVIRADISFTEEDRIALQEHLEMFGPSVWDHTTVLFTRGDWLGHTPIEEHIECEGRALQWVIDKCGNRYHVFDNMDKTDIQVIHLFKKLESMVTKKGGHHFEMEQRKCQEMEDKWRMVEEKAKNRRMQRYRDRATLQWVMGTCSIPGVEILLLGSQKAGKSSAGNTIFKETCGGAEVFNTAERTSQCVKRTDMIAMRQVTVVDTPGWSKAKSGTGHLHDDELIRTEIRHNVSLLPHAHHAVLLVIDLESAFTEEDRRAAQEHLELLGENIWSRTIVLFSYGDCLGEKTIEQHIESEGQALEGIIRMCGNRYHVFDNTKKYDDHQVTELLEKIEEMNDLHMDRSLQVLPSVRSVQMTLWMGQAHYRAHLEPSAAVGKCMFLSELSIVLLGSRKAGKSSAGNTISGGKKVFNNSKRTSQCVMRTNRIAQRQVTVMDTPGWTEEQPDTDLSTTEIGRCVSLLPRAPHAVLLVIDLESAFTKEHRRAAQEHVELLGENIWSRTIVLFSYGDCLGEKTIEQHIESEGRPLQWIIRMCGNRYHVFDNTKKDKGQQVRQLLEKIEEMTAMDVLDRNNMNWEVEEELERSRHTPPAMEHSVQVLSSHGTALTPPLMGQSRSSSVDSTGSDRSSDSSQPVQSSNPFRQWWKAQKKRAVKIFSTDLLSQNSDSGSGFDSNNSGRSDRSIRSNG